MAAYVVALCRRGIRIPSVCLENFIGLLKFNLRKMMRASTSPGQEMNSDIMLSTYCRAPDYANPLLPTVAIWLTPLI